MEWLYGVLTSPPAISFFSAMLMYGSALLGAILMYLFAAKNGLEGTSAKLRQLVPGRSDTFYFRLDFVLVIMLGPIVGLICFRPQDAFQALAAGCGWVSALNVLVQQKPTPPEPPQKGPELPEPPKKPEPPKQLQKPEPPGPPQPKLPPTEQSQQELTLTEQAQQTPVSEDK